MIDIIKQQFTDGMSPERRSFLAREFLQVLCLKILSDKKAFETVAFIGGTSLRILYGMKRFSEDIDLSLIRRDGFDFLRLKDELVRSFGLYGIVMEGVPKVDRNVHSLMMKFPGLPKELGLSSLAAQNILIKMEADVNPPEGWKITNTALTRVFMFNVVHYDLPSLFSGKLHALFFRKYTKGRDVYDFLWYAGRKVRPNLELLNNAIAQTEGLSPGITDGTLKDYILDRLQRIDLCKARKDVERFLEDKSELDLFEARIIHDTVVNTFSYG